MKEKKKEKEDVGVVLDVRESQEKEGIMGERRVSNNTKSGCGGREKKRVMFVVLSVFYIHA